MERETIETKQLALEEIHRQLRNTRHEIQYPRLLENQIAQLEKTIVESSAKLERLRIRQANLIQIESELLAQSEAIQNEIKTLRLQPQLDALRALAQNLSPEQREKWLSQSDLGMAKKF